jgi:hypothetical protein
VCDVRVREHLNHQQRNGHDAHRVIVVGRADDGSATAVTPQFMR